MNNDSSTMETDGGVLRLRRTVLNDVEPIYKLIRQEITDIFGRVRILTFVEKCLLSFTVLDEKNEIVAFACFSDYPNFSKECDEEIHWLDWMKDNFEWDESDNYLNSFFIWYFASKEEPSVDAARLIMRELYISVSFLQNCFLICPEGVPLNEALITVFYPLSKKLGCPDSRRGFVGKREHHSQLLHVREAKVEDNDDLIPLFEENADLLRKTYGEYFVAEFVKNQDEYRRCLVAEVEGVAVGFMSINSKFEVDPLCENFDLSPFNGLRVEDSDSDLETENGEEWLQKSQLKSFDDTGLDTQIEEIENEEEEEEEEEEVGKEVEEEEEKGEKEEDEEETVGDKTKDEEKDIEEGKDMEETETSLYADDSTSRDNSSFFSDLTTKSLYPITMTTEVFETESKCPFNHSLVFDKEDTEVEKFPGIPSCVCVEIFAIDRKFSSRASAFLMKIFETFPDKVYCIINLSYLVPEPPLMAHFTRVTPLIGRNPLMALYVCASPSVLDNINIRLATLDDLPSIKELLGGLVVAEEVLKDVVQTLDYGVDEERIEMPCYVADMDDQIIGVAVVKLDEDIEYIRSHYNIEDFVQFNQHKREHYKLLLHFVVNPAFNYYSSFFLLELLRSSRTSNLCHKIYPAVVDASVPGVKQLKSVNTISSALDIVVPVSARRQIEYNLEDLQDRAPSLQVTQKKDPFHLMFISRKNILEPRTCINARIVVVGASDTAIAFLETLIFNPTLKFTNLTLISTNGLLGDSVECTFTSTFFSHNHCYSHRNLTEMGLRVWINVVVGKMTFLDRDNKIVTVDSKWFIPYDYLFMTTGCQYLIYCPPSIDHLTGLMIPRKMSRPTGLRTLQVEAPKNVWVVNDEKEALRVLNYVNQELKDDKRMVVHGNTLDAYCCVNALLNAGVSPARIIFSLPPLETEMTCLNNVEIDCDLIRNLRNIQGLKVLRDVVLEGWKQTKMWLSAVVFSNTDGTFSKVNCDALILYTHKGVDLDAFHAINCSTLVFDRRLVIDAHFRTNDPYVWAAGPLTKYKRSYYCSDNNHIINNSKEVGYSLANSVMYLFDEVNYEAPPTDQSITQTYVWPKIRAALLPGNYSYFHVKKPEVEKPLIQEEKNHEYGHLLKTGRLGSNHHPYFRLHINKLGFVETITCYTTKHIPSNNLICLYGLHEKFLNNILDRWYQGLIKDLYVFLSEPWANVIYHDHFIDLRTQIKKAALAKYTTGLHGEMESLEDYMHKKLDENLQMRDDDLSTMKGIFKANKFNSRIHECLSNYLSAKHYHLPMFARPFC